MCTGCWFKHCAHLQSLIMLSYASRHLVSVCVPCCDMIRSVSQNSMSTRAAVCRLHNSMNLCDVTEAEGARLLKQPSQQQGLPDQP